MKHTFFFILITLAILSTAPSCAKYGCPSNTENYKAKVKKKSKLKDGVVPADYAKKRNLDSKPMR